MNSLLAMLCLAAIGALAAFLVSLVKSWREEGLSARFAELLPGENCQLCGYASCESYAQQLALGKESACYKCSKQNGFEKDNLASALKRAGLKPERLPQSGKIAQIFCRANDNTAAKRFVYKGLQRCDALTALAQSDKECRAGCLGLGDCIPVCPWQAIKRNKKLGLIEIDPKKCTGCGFCVEACPKNVIRLIPYSADYFVACSSMEGADETSGKCSVGCTACGNCQKSAPVSGYVIYNNLCSIDYNAAGRDRWQGAVNCPSSCICPLADREKARFFESSKNAKDT